MNDRDIFLAELDAVVAWATAVLRSVEEIRDGLKLIYAKQEELGPHLAGFEKLFDGLGEILENGPFLG